MQFGEGEHKWSGSAPDSVLESEVIRVGFDRQPSPMGLSLSPAPSSRGAREVREGVKVLMDLQHGSVLLTLGRLLLFAACPVSIAVLALQIRANAVTVWFVCELLGLVAATIAARSQRMQLDHRKVVAGVGFVVMAIASLLHFGPLIVVGFLFVLALLVSVALLGRQEAVFVATALAVGLSGAGVLQVYFPALSPAAQTTLSSEQWARVIASSCVGIYGVLFVFQRLQTSLWLSLEKEIAARVRERRLVSEREKVLRGAASAQRLESLGRLAGGVAHDFNNALVVIQCGIEALYDDLDERERREIMEELRDGVERASSTARQLLAFSRRNVEDIGETDPSAVLARLHRESPRLVPAHVELEVCFDEAVPRVAVSEPAFEQLILNLLSNSLDALQQGGGKIRVTASMDPLTSGLLLCVEDNGPGMMTEIAEQAFEPFFTTKGDRANGLGLSTVWGVVHRHGGKVLLDSEPGKGTRITVRLPAVAADPSTHSVELRASSLMPHSGMRAPVLVLEDEAPVRAALRRILKNLELDVTEVSTVAEARRACRRQRYCLLLTDGVVPDGGVGAFIHEFFARQPGASVILCSGYLEEDLSLEGIARGRFAYLGKPFAASELAALVTRLLGEGAEAPVTKSSAL